MKNIKLGLSAAMILAMASGATAMSAKAADGGTYESNGKVGFEANTSTTPVDPIDPTNPTEPILPVDPTDPNGPNPGTPGPLSIDYASSIDFGSNEISNLDRTYYAEPQTYSDQKDKKTANYVQVTDRRGTNGGWTLSLKQNHQFKNDTTQNKELVGAKLSFVKGTTTSGTTNAVHPSTMEVAELDPTGASSSTIVSAAPTQGSGTFADLFGDVEKVDVQKGDEKVSTDKNTGISLFVPGATPKDAVEYTTKLTWTLSDIPGNK